MALCTFDKEPQPHGRGGLDSVDGVLDAVLLVDHPTLIRRAVVSVETRRDSLSQCCVGDQVSRDLLDRKLIERLIRVVGSDDPISPGPHVAMAVGVVDAGVSVAGEIEPHHRHTLAVVRRRKQSIDDPLVRKRRRVGEECIDLVESRRKAGEVERHATDQSRPIRLG